MTDEPISPELQIPKQREVVDTKAIARIEEIFEAKCLHCFFMQKDYKFEVKIAQCHLAPPENCV
jgi:hypothetical protein